jgi:hypothetical protein
MERSITGISIENGKFFARKVELSICQTKKHVQQNHSCEINFKKHTHFLLQVVVDTSTETCFLKEGKEPGH